MVAGGVHGCQGACMVARGHAWLLGHMHGCGGCAWLQGHVWLWGCAWLQGACVVAGGMCMVARGHAWLWGACVIVGGMRGCQGVCLVAGGMHRIRRDTVNEQAVCILLECILVLLIFGGKESLLFRIKTLFNLTEVACS